MRPLLLFLFFVFSFLAPAQQKILLENGMEVTPVGKKMWIYEDKTHSLSFEQVSSPGFASHFKKNETDLAVFNVSKSVFWCRLSFQNNSSYDDWCIQEKVPSIRSATCYIVGNGGVSVHESGLVKQNKDREISLITSAFFLHAPQDSSVTVYMRLEDNGPFQANLYAGRLSQFTAQGHLNDVMNGIYFGVMLFMLLYNLFLFFSFRDRAYIYYAVYIICTCLFMLYLTGYLAHFPDRIKKIFLVYPSVSPVLFGLSALLFTVKFLEIFRQSKWLTKAFYVTLILIAADLVISFSGYPHESVIYVQLMGFLMCGYAIACGVVTLKKGFRPAKYYLMAWTLYMAGLCVYILSDFGLIPFNGITHGAFQYGSLFEATLLSFALADKVDALREDKKKAQLEALSAAKENERIIREQNIILEEKVQERTHEIQLQSAIIEEKNKDILSSIHYAKRIQRALLASDMLLKNNLADFFVLYKPKDIVSGDFYWANTVPDGKFLLLTGDCTGHGVPGAFMSLLNISILHELVAGRKVYRPDLILNAQKEMIISSLNPEGAEERSRDGMDAVLCSFDLENNILEFACANNPVWIFRNGALMEFKGDKQPIGIYEGANVPFRLHREELKKGDVIYTLTDGFADQFGGPKGKKFKYSQLKEKLTAISGMQMEEQKEILDRLFEEWKGGLEQVDDVLVIGVRI